MTRDTTSPGPRTRVESADPARAARNLAAKHAPSSLGARVANTDRRNGDSPGNRRCRLRLAWAWPVVAAAVVGVTLVLAEPFRYRCAATLESTADVDPRQLESYRAELLSHCRELAPTGVPGTDTEHWSVEIRAPRRLRLLCLTTADRTTGLGRVNRAAETYLVKVESLRSQARSTPTEAEVVLLQYASSLQARSSEIEGQLEAAEALLPMTDPQQQHEALLERWETSRLGFADARRELAEADAEIDRLESEPEPTHGIVPAEERRKARKADVALQQDLRELRVRLAEVKLHLLNVWRESVGKLDALQAAANELTGDDSLAERLRAAGDLREAVEDLLEEARQYRDVLLAFSESWTREFTALRQGQVDPLSSELLDLHDRTHRLLSDYLFLSAKHLAGMRELMRRISEGPTDHARYYVLQSDLTRGFQAVQTAHHRFEFVADALDMSDNFRLDSALRSARGLRRRSQQRMRSIDKRLEARAAELARNRRRHDLAEVRRHFEEVRERADGIIEKLIVLQEDLNLNADRRESYFGAVRNRELIASRYEQTERDLSEIQKRLGELAAKRKSVPDGPTLELTSCEVVDGPVNLVERCRTGGIGAMLTFVAVAFGQWWTGRRS